MSELQLTERTRRPIVRHRMLPAHVLRQLRSGQPDCARPTLVHRHRFVHVHFLHMFADGIQSHKTIPTNVTPTFYGSIPTTTICCAVQTPSMPIVAGPLGVTFAAVFALVRFGAGVRSHVNRTRRRMPELFAACRTVVRVVRIRMVLALVVSERRRSCVRFGALHGRTTIRFGCHMDVLVFVQLRLCGVPFFALPIVWTAERGVLMFSPHVKTIVGDVHKRAVTVQAFVWPFTGVLNRMGFQLSAPREGFAAVGMRTVE